MPVARIEPWVRNFVTRHGETALDVVDGTLTGTAADGSRFVARPPFGASYAGAADPAAFAMTCAPPRSWGILLVRKGGFAVARFSGAETIASKVGQRHVQGRTKAGGQSQQRFARRRDNQARAAYEAAAEHAARILGTDLPVLLCGGDRSAVEQVLQDRRLRPLAERRVEPWLPVPDPRRAVLEQAAADGRSVAVTVIDPL